MVVGCKHFERERRYVSDFIVEGKLRVSMKWVKTRPGGGGK